MKPISSFSEPLSGLFLTFKNTQLPGKTSLQKLLLCTAKSRDRGRKILYSKERKRGEVPWRFIKAVTE